jgi:hypothetical protein
VITPAYAHMHCDASSSALTPLMVTLAEPGVHGDSSGTHGWGTSGPAEEAAATVGLASDVHKPKVGIFSSDTSVITPAEVVAETATLDTVNSAGTVPNVHAIAAPVETWFATVYLPCLPPGRLSEFYRIKVDVATI